MSKSKKMFRLYVELDKDLDTKLRYIEYILNKSRKDIIQKMIADSYDAIKEAEK